MSCPVRLPRRNSGEACQNLPVELILLVRLPGRPALTETFSFEFCKLFVSRPFSPRPSLSNGGIRFDALKIGRKDLLPHNLPCFTPRHLDGARTSPTHQKFRTNREAGSPGGGCITSAGNANNHNHLCTSYRVRHPGGRGDPRTDVCCILAYRIPASKSRVQILPGSGLRNTSTNPTSTSLLPPPQKYDIVALIQSRSSVELQDNLYCRRYKVSHSRGVDREQLCCM